LDFDCDEMGEQDYDYGGLSQLDYDYNALDEQDYDCGELSLLDYDCDDLDEQDYDCVDQDYDFVQMKHQANESYPSLHESRSRRHCTIRHMCHRHDHV
jgi:hypothetical protein